MWMDNPPMCLSDYWSYDNDGYILWYVNTYCKLLMQSEICVCILKCSHYCHKHAPCWRMHIYVAKCFYTRQIYNTPVCFSDYWFHNNAYCRYILAYVSTYYKCILRRINAFWSMCLHSEMRHTNVTNMHHVEECISMLQDAFILGRLLIIPCACLITGFTIMCIVDTFCYMLTLVVNAFFHVLMHSEICVCILKCFTLLSQTCSMLKNAYPWCKMFLY
jgi:hypothetical protein